jgi:hypothetical protein
MADKLLGHAIPHLTRAFIELCRHGEMQTALRQQLLVTLGKPGGPLHSLPQRLHAGWFGQKIKRTQPHGLLAHRMIVLTRQHNGLEQRPLAQEVRQQLQTLIGQTGERRQTHVDDGHKRLVFGYGLLCDLDGLRPLMRHQHLPAIVGQ